MISDDFLMIFSSQRTFVIFPKGGQTIDVSDDSRIPDSAISSTRCDRSIFSITVRFDETVPYRYQCVTSTVTDANKVESNVEEMRTYSKFSISSPPVPLLQVNFPSPRPLLQQDVPHRDNQHVGSARVSMPERTRTHQ